MVSIGKTALGLPALMNSDLFGRELVVEPTRKKASIKLHLRFDVISGAFQHFQLTDGITADSEAEKEFEPLPVGSLRLADLGYFSLEAFEKLTQTSVFWITRLKVDCKRYNEQGEPFCLHKHLKATNLDTI